MTRLEGGPGPITRRRLLGAAGTGTALVAGCLGGAGGGDEESGADGTDDGEGDADGENRYADAVVDHPVDEPLAFDGGYHCPVCGMSPQNYANWYCQLAHENGEGAVFDTPGCLFAYYAFQPVDAPVAAGWVIGFETRDLIDATAAHYVLVTDTQATADEPMGPNPRPFADREDAIAYLEEWEAEEVSEDDIVSLDDVDEELAEVYRGNRLP